jgi:hypothetical protein
MNTTAAIMSIHFPTLDEVRRVKRKAKEMGMTPSAYLRMMALSGLDNFNLPAPKKKLRVIQGGKR